MKNDRNEKYAVRLDFSGFPEHGGGVEEIEFDSREDAVKYLEDQYSNWFADDESIAEEVIFPALCAAKEEEE